jgi:type I restriction enzyme R subunit
VENFTLFSEHKAGLVKIIGQNHQFLGVNNAIASMLAREEAGHGRGGVFWHTQGSGKSLSMVFFAQKVLRKVLGSWTFVVVTDREELDDQISQDLQGHWRQRTRGDVPRHQRRAPAGAAARQQRYVFTLIQKFQERAGEPYPMLCDRIGRDRHHRRGAPQPVRHRSR